MQDHSFVFFQKKPVPITSSWIIIEICKNSETRVVAHHRVY